MESSPEPITVRVNRLNAQILGNPRTKGQLISKEGLLDAFQVLYDECSNNEHLRKCDRNVQNFVDKYRKAIREMGRLRVNLTDFDIKGVIGRGHYGEVHLVRERQTGDVYAMKTVKKSERIASFEAERDIMARARPPWLTTLRHSFQDDASLYFIMEYHPGGDLLGLLCRQGGSLPESAATFYIGELVLALHDLHEMGYVHRDVKPDNVLIDRCGHVKLADFGSAARFDEKGMVGDGFPVGTPDYVAPEVLASLDNKGGRERSAYGVACDFWSLGILAYELTVGTPPFTGQSTSSLYTKIMNHEKLLKFPPDIVLSQAYISFVKGLVSDQKRRLGYDQIIKHPLFKHVDLRGLRDQVPPYIPKITSEDDTSNFSDVQPKKNEPNIENFKRKTQFSGRNLPFVGFTYTHDVSADYSASRSRSVKIKDELVQDLKREVQALRRQAAKSEAVAVQKQELERKLEEKTIKLEGVAHSRDKLERDLSKSVSENLALKRTLELERKDRVEVEQKALELIKAAKQKWEASDRTRTEILELELEQQKEKIVQLTTANETLNEQLKHALHLGNRHKITTENIEKLSRKSVIGLESRLEKVTTETQNQLAELKEELAREAEEKKRLAQQVSSCRNDEVLLQQKLEEREKRLEDSRSELFALKEKVELLAAENRSIQAYKEQIDNLKRELHSRDFELQKRLETETLELEQAKRENQKLEAQLSRALAETTAKTAQISDLQVRIESLASDRLVCQTKLEASIAREDDNKNRVLALEELLARLQEGITKLEGGGGREDLLRQQVERLEQQLVQTHESTALVKQELGQLKTKHWRMEKELENAEIDKRILQRELRECEKAVGELKAEAERSKRALQEGEKEKEELRGALGRMGEVEREAEREKGVAERLRLELEAERKAGQDLSRELALMREEREDLNGKCEALKAENSQLRDAVGALTTEKLAQKTALEDKENQLRTSQLNFDALRGACVILEDQLVEYETLVDSMRDQQAAADSETEQWLQRLARAQEETREARRQANEEKSLRLLAETKHKRLGEEAEGARGELEAARQRYAEMKGYSAGLAEELNALQARVGDLEAAVRVGERTVEEANAEIAGLKRECSARLTQLENVRAANYELKQKVEEYKDANGRLRERLGELEALLNEKLGYYKERELKSDATIQQQTKLINYLQSKIEEHNNKKKSFAEKFFNHSSKKENIPPNFNGRDLEEQLNRERQKNKALRDEIESLRRIAKKAADPAGDKTDIDRNVEIEGWIRLPNLRSKTWDKNYAKLTSDALYLFAQPKESIPKDSFVFKRPETHSKYVMEPLPSEIDLAPENHELTLLIKLEVTPDSKCWPPESLVFLLPDQEEKEKWGRALRAIFQDSVWMQLQGDLVFKLPGNLGVNCAIELMHNVFLLGTQKGLYSHHNGTLTRIEGPSEVHQICTIKSANVALMIAEEKRNLISANLNHLVDLSQCAPCTKPTLKHEKVSLKNLNGFHFLQVSKQGKFCVATPKQLIIAEHDLETREFVPLRFLDTAQPTSCAHFTRHTVIVGADKFFEIDLSSFIAEEFLDASDASLKLATSCHKMKSFPVAVVPVRKQPTEYLCCYHEFAVFVDEYGRNSRGVEVKWRYLPFAVHFASPYLYVMQFQALEIYRVKDEGGLDEPMRVSFASSVQYLGENASGVFVVSEGEVRFFDGRRLDADGDLSASECTESESGDRFSFTSSVVQCLEDNFSETGSESSYQPKRAVTFTDL